MRWTWLQTGKFKHNLHNFHVAVLRGTNKCCKSILIEKLHHTIRCAVLVIET